MSDVWEAGSDLERRQRIDWTLRNWGCRSGCIVTAFCYYVNEAYWKWPGENWYPLKAGLLSGAGGDQGGVPAHSSQYTYRRYKDGPGYLLKTSFGLFSKPLRWGYNWRGRSAHCMKTPYHFIWIVLIIFISLWTVCDSRSTSTLHYDWIIILRALYIMIGLFCNSLFLCYTYHPDYFTA